MFDNKIYVIGLSNAKKITESICKSLKIKPINATISKFADGEIMVRPESSVRNRSITIVQSISKPVNENLMELLIAIDAVKRASAKDINVVITYYAYARQDRKTNGREPITSKLIARLLETAGATRVTVVDIHSDQTQGFFEIPFDNIKSSKMLVTEAIKKISKKNLVVVSPDYGGIKRSRNIANFLQISLAILDKRRPRPNEAEIMNVLGDVEGKDCLIVDDMVDTGGTIVAAAKLLKAKKAKTVTFVATHAILSDPATKNLTEAVKNNYLNNIYVSNTVSSVYERKIPSLHIVDIGPYLANIIKIYYSVGISLSKIYDAFKMPKK